MIKLELVWYFTYTTFWLTRHLIFHVSKIINHLNHPPVPINHHRGGMFTMGMSWVVNMAPGGSHITASPVPRLGA